jgi:tripartite-type tricarboxylate transporter receptor subunit TctC
MHAVQCATFAIAIAAGVAFAPALVHAQPQQKFPNKPVRVVVPNPAGSQGDALARLIAQKLSDTWGQPVVVDNRGGGIGTVAGSMVVKSAPDGHTLLQTAGFSISAVLQTNLPYDPLKDFAGVAQIGIGTQVLIVGPALGVKSVKDFIAFARTQPRIIYSSSAVGTGSHLNGARFALATGIKIVTVAFKGGPEAVVEVMAGRSHYSSVTLFSALPHVNDGKLVAIAVAIPQRAPQLPDVPTLAETFPDFKRPENSTGILAPAGTPRPILLQISKDVARVLDLPDIKERLQGMGYFSAPSSPEEFDTILRTQIETLSRVVTDAGLRPK